LRDTVQGRGHAGIKADILGADGNATIINVALDHSNGIRVGTGTIVGLAGEMFGV
jgi:hypothetical protein